MHLLQISECATRASDSAAAANDISATTAAGAWLRSARASLPQVLVRAVHALVDQAARTQATIDVDKLLVLGARQSGEGGGAEEGLDEIASAAQSDMEKVVGRHRLADPRECLQASLIRRHALMQTARAPRDREQSRAPHTHIP